MNLHSKKVLVVGFGKTGFSAARFLLARGARVTLTDIQKKVDVPAEFVEQGVSVEAGGHRIETFINQDLIVMSPGVSIHMRPVIEAQSRGIEVISEVELAYRFLKAPLIAVTGTNGKTTTTALIGHMFETAGRSVFVGGNIGTPLIDFALEGREPEYVISEISSFQLESIKEFRPHISVLLNVTEDHLDRHPSFNEYLQAKSRIFMNQKKSDFAVLNFDDLQVRGLGARMQAETFFFSSQKAFEQGAYYDGEYHFARGDETLAFSAREAALTGAHNRENMLAAGAVGFLCGLPADSIRRALVTFVSLPHRMEFVDEVQGVRFYNDSKGTNVGACLRSLESLDPPLILIAGGKDKGGSYLPLQDVLHRKAKALIVLGEAKQRIADELGDAVTTILADTLDQAVEAAFARAEPGDSVLLSPACSSFDMFQSYAHRGECYKNLVKKIKEKTDACTTKA